MQTARAKINFAALAGAVVTARLDAGMTQQQVADASGLSKSTISRLEQSDKPRLEPEVLMKICRWLKVTPESFVVGAEHIKDNSGSTINKIARVVYDDPRLGFQDANSLMDILRTAYTQLTKERVAKIGQSRAERVTSAAAPVSQ